MESSVDYLPECQENHPGTHRGAPFQGSGPNPDRLAGYSSLTISWVASVDERSVSSTYTSDI